MSVLDIFRRYLDIYYKFTDLFYIIEHALD